MDENRNVQQTTVYTIRIVARILDAAACLMKREYQLRRTTRHLYTGVAKFTEVYGRILESLFWTITDTSFLF